MSKKHQDATTTFVVKKVTANTRHVVTRQFTVQQAGTQFPQSRSDSVAFNFGSNATFPGNLQGQATECLSTGQLEREILSLIN